MKKYEYRLYISSGGHVEIDELNKLGQEGWKLISAGGAYNNYWVFMREDKGE